MKKLLIILALIIPTVGFPQKPHKMDFIDETPLTLSPLIFDINMDSTIVRIEFIQDAANNIYDIDEEAKYSSIEKKENFEQIYAIGLIGDFRVSRNMISVIIKTYHTNGEVKTFPYVEKIDKLSYYSDFEWATYGTKGVYFFYFDRGKTKPLITSKCDI
jgi:hypothetical protein